MDSFILNDAKKQKSLAEMIPGPSKKRFELLMRGTKDGFLSQSFHNKVDNKGPTLILVKSAIY